MIASIFEETVEASMASLSVAVEEHRSNALNQSLPRTVGPWARCKAFGEGKKGKREPTNRLATLFVLLEEPRPQHDSHLVSREYAPALADPDWHVMRQCVVV